MTDAFVDVVIEDGFATLTLDSPRNRNALSTKLVTELRAALAAAAQNDDVRAVILTHTGNTFCAGADLSEATTDDPATAAAKRTRMVIELMREIVALDKPVIAVIDGNVRAGGMGIVGACDIAVASQASSFALTEVRIGVAPFMISLTLLPRLSDRAAARYYLTGEKFDAVTAERIGLITIATNDTHAAVLQLRQQLRLGSPQGLREAKRLTTAAVLEGFDRDGDELAERSAKFFATEEAWEGMAAFLQKRAPRWAV